MGSKSSTSSDSDTGSDSGSSSDSGKKGKFVKAKKGENPFAKKDDSSETDSSDDKKDEDMAKDDKKKDEVEETLTFNEADIEGIVEVEDDDDKDDVEEDCGDDHDDDDDDDKGGKFVKGKKGVNPFAKKDDVKEMGGEYAMGHEMGGGEIAVTTEFMVKLLQGVAAANLDDEKFQMIADCIADCCGEDRTLDVGDIGAVMSKLQDKVSGGGDDMGDYGDEEGAEEDVAVGDGEVAGPEGGDEYEGETKLMAGRGRPMRESKGKKRSRRGKRQLDEMWIAGIPGMTAGTQPKRKEVNTDGMTEDEIFDAEIKLMQQRAGIID